ncbi:hypothetical protein [Micromonospora tarensis]|uniref:Uncharacterized protein n=1 Tax=Micromonospora tarensis TaxID=2806100 RepID=A0ABS1YP80_9ACTN|nr:hypothetical protein [Micromonospora tarensis]MBM0279103.1 hypothetical protein [Micromonospora tarensis]
MLHFARMEKRFSAASLFLSLAALLTTCSSSASPEKQMKFLRTMAQHGVELHAVKSLGSFGDQEKCSDAYQQLYDGPNGHVAPHVEDYGRKSRLAERRRAVVHRAAGPARRRRYPREVDPPALPPDRHSGRLREHPVG